uniref:Thiamin pyrophosphokinase thiamin-binding domain-containing protein n=1 Tax=Cuerna arida TaxID=1464854 RepID=A0A1B6FRE0_9HEMI
MVVTVWKVPKLFNGHINDVIGRFAVLILNRPINIPDKYVVELWNKACLRATADGGTDRWYKFVSLLKCQSELKQMHPDFVSGDFDSIKPETLAKCKENGVTVIPTPDQDKTDFTKALEEIMKLTRNEIDSVIVIVEDSGRLDHIMSNLNTLYNTSEVFGSSCVRLYLFSTETLTWLLPAGSHEIQVPQSFVQCQAKCGLIPLGAPCVVSSSGLKWNLEKDKMEFGGLISSCNTYSKTCNGIVTIETDNPLLWTMSLIMANN